MRRRSRNRWTRRGQALRLPTFGRRSGQALTELVIVLPGVLFLILLAWELAYFWWSREVVSTAAFEAARQVAAGESTAEGYAVYDEVLASGMGRMSREHRGGFSLAVEPARRSVRARANVPYRWPTGLGALLGDGFHLNLHLKASAFFRLEPFYPGPPDEFE